MAPNVLTFSGSGAATEEGLGVGAESPDGAVPVADGLAIAWGVGEELATLLDGALGLGLAGLLGPFRGAVTPGAATPGAAPTVATNVPANTIARRNVAYVLVFIDSSNDFHARKSKTRPREIVAAPAELLAVGASCSPYEHQKFNT